MSRPTVYRYFADKEQLIGAVILREEQRLLDRVAAATAGIATFRDAVEQFITEVLGAVRSHPLLNRLLDTEAEALLPFLTTNRGPVLSAAFPAACDLLRRWVPDLPEERLARAADTLARLLISYGVNPPSAPPQTVAADLAQLVVFGLAGEDPPRAAVAR